MRHEDLPVWRSLMYVPVNVDKFVEGAHKRGADVVQLDLEDSVPASEKDKARTLVEGAAKKVRRGGADVVVRINAPLALAVRDIESSVCPDVDAIAITKVDGESHIRLLDELAGEIEEKRGLRIGHTKFICVIESARALLRVEEITRASDRIVACAFGGEDFALDCNMQPTGEALFHPKQHMILAASAAGIMPIGFIDSVNSFGDWEAFRAMVRRSRDLGFMAAGCIHPGQVTIVNEEYAPTAQEVEYARKVTQMHNESLASGRGAWSLDGKMIDAPVVKRAEKLLRRHEAIRAREEKARAVSDA